MFSADCKKLNPPQCNFAVSFFLLKQSFLAEPVDDQRPHRIGHRPMQRGIG